MSLILKGDELHELCGKTWGLTESYYKSGNEEDMSQSGCSRNGRRFPKPICSLDKYILIQEEEYESMRKDSERKLRELKVAIETIANEVPDAG